MSMTLPRCWILRADRPGVIAGPSGREYKVAWSREEAVLVVRTVVESLERRVPGSTLKARKELSLEKFFGLMPPATADAPEDVQGAALAQWIDVLTWDLKWEDVTKAAAQA